MAQTDTNSFKIARALYKLEQAFENGTVALTDRIFAELSADANGAQYVQDLKVVLTYKGTMRFQLPKDTDPSQLIAAASQLLNEALEAGLHYRQAGLRDIRPMPVGDGVVTNAEHRTVLYHVVGTLVVAVSEPKRETLAAWKLNPIGFDFAAWDDTKSEALAA